MLYNKYILLLYLKVTLWSIASSLCTTPRTRGKKKKPSHVDGIDWIAWSKKMHILLNFSL